mmetsp:Transcript_62183/g.192741  ORF Transcript_62183/g.192741 Transcript_62183/m.192741 type:complete len:273 (-) Transcript_62183:597-1415(-)
MAPRPEASLHVFRRLPLLGSAAAPDEPTVCLEDGPLGLLWRVLHPLLSCQHLRLHPVRCPGGRAVRRRQPPSRRLLRDLRLRLARHHGGNGAAFSDDEVCDEPALERRHLQAGTRAGRPLPAGPLVRRCGDRRHGRGVQQERHAGSIAEPSAGDVFAPARRGPGLPRLAERQCWRGIGPWVGGHRGADCRLLQLRHVLHRRVRGGGQADRFCLRGLHICCLVHGRHAPGCVLAAGAAGVGEGPGRCARPACPQDAWPLAQQALPLPPAGLDH